MEESYEKKIEIIKQKTNLSDEAARVLLDKYDGDVIEALIQFERSKVNSSNQTSDSMNPNEFINFIKNLIQCGNVSKIIIKKDSEVLVNIPVTAGVVIGVAMLLEPVLLVLGAATAVFTKLEIDIVKCDGTVQVVNTAVKNGMKNGTKAMGEMGSEFKTKFTAGYGNFKEKISHMNKK